MSDGDCFVDTPEDGGTARLGLLRSLAQELEGIDAPSFVVRIEQVRNSDGNSEN